MNLGERVKHIRTKYYKKNQTEMCNLINTYAIQNNIPEFKKFTQNNISELENENRITQLKLSTIINFYYDTMRINPSWILLNNNNSQPLFLKKIEIDQNLIEIHEQLKSYSKSINQGINDIRIIIDNSSHQ